MEKLLKTIILNHQFIIQCLALNAYARSSYSIRNVQLKLNSFKSANGLFRRCMFAYYAKVVTQRVNHYKQFRQKNKDSKFNRYLPLTIAAAIPIEIIHNNKKIQTFDENDISSISKFLRWLNEGNNEITDEMILYNLEKSINILNKLNENNYNDEQVKELVGLNHSLLFNRPTSEKTVNGLHEVYNKMIKYHLNQVKMNEIILMSLLAGVRFCLTADSTKFLIQENAIKPVLDLIKNSNFLSKDKLRNDDSLNLYFVITSFLLKMSWQKEGREHLIKLNSIDYLIDHVNQMNKVLAERKELQFAKLRIIATIANLISDEEMNDLPSKDDFASTLCNGLNECIKNKDKNQLIQNTKFYREFTIKNIIHYVYAEDYLRYLIKITSFDSIKTKVIDDSSNIIELLEVMLLYGNQIEKELTAELLNSLCFSEIIVQKLQNKKTKLMRLIKNLKEETKNNETKRYCQQIIELLNPKLNEVTVETPEISSKQQLKTTKIMISYQHTHQDKCLKLYDELKKRNYNVWMDVKEDFNDLYKAMAKAVEEASLIVVCYSKEYQESLNCRYEVTYASTLKKNMIFINMDDDNFKPDSWLGMMISWHKYIKYSENMYEELNKQIMSTHGDASQSDKTKDVTKWSCEDVKNWFRQNEMKHLSNVFGKYDGIALLSLYELKVKSLDKFIEIFEQEIRNSKLKIEENEKMRFFYLLENRFKNK